MEEASAVDQYLVCGEDYKTIRNAVAKMVMEGKVDGVEETCEVMLPHFLISNNSRLFCRILVYVGVLLCPHRGAKVDNITQQFTFCWRCTEKSPRSTEKLLTCIPNLR